MSAARSATWVANLGVLPHGAGLHRLVVDADRDLQRDPAAPGRSEKHKSAGFAEA